MPIHTHLNHSPKFQLTGQVGGYRKLLDLLDRLTVMASRSAEQTIKSYYSNLRTGRPLIPFFAEEDEVVKIGISEHRHGYESVKTALTSQTRETTDWTVESNDLRVTERDAFAWFTDRVRLAWMNTKTELRHDFETRWSGTLERQSTWNFVVIHVSVATSLG